MTLISNRLHYSARVIPKPLLWTMRILGIAGTTIAAIPKALSLHKGITDKSLSRGERKHKIISGSLGLTSAAAFGIGAFFITPAGLTIGTIALLAGGAILATQTIYDGWPKIKKLCKPHTDNLIK